MSDITTSGLINNTQKATRREWLGLAVLVLPTLLVSIDMTITYLALPAISAALKPTSAELLWITDIYGFLEAGLLIIMGTLGDRIGLRKILLAGSVAFAAASVAGAFSTNALMLIVSRGVMGIAGATLLPATLSLIRNMFHNDVERTFAMGLYTTCFSAGTMIGPLVGGILLNHFWWGSVFLVAVPIMLLMVACAPFLLPEYKNSHGEKIDLASAVLLIISILAIIFGIKQLAQDGFAWSALLYIIAGTATALLFFRRQQKLANPLIDLQLFRKRNFSIPLLALLVGLFSWAGIFFLLGQYLQLVKGLNAFHAALWTVPGSIGSIVLCMLAPIAVKHMQRGFLIAAGLAILASGIALTMLIDANSTALLVAAIVLLQAGCGLTVTIGIDMVVAAAPPGKAGAAAGISETSTAFGGSFGIAILGSLWTFLYRRGISNHMPAILTGKDADAVRNTLGGALEVAKTLPSAQRLSLSHTASHAFVHSLHITSGICAAVVFVVAVIVATRLRRH